MQMVQLNIKHFGNKLGLYLPYKSFPHTKVKIALSGVLSRLTDVDFIKWIRRSKFKANGSSEKYLPSTVLQK